MKTSVLYPFLSLGLLMTSCVVVEPGTEGGTSPSSTSSEGSDAGPGGWQAGYEKGLSDGRGGLSRTPSRYDSIYSEADRADFLRGYESGYNRGIRP